MVNVKFKYRDKYSYPNWNEQQCRVSSVEECIRIYGLGTDCEYEILSVETEEDAVIRQKAENAFDEIMGSVFAPSLKVDANEKLLCELKTVLLNSVFKMCYRAFEGDFRIITTDVNGEEHRYILNKDGSLTLKP